MKHIFAYFFINIVFGECENDKIRKSYKKNFIIKMFYTIFKLREKMKKKELSKKCREVFCLEQSKETKISLVFYVRICF